MYNRKPSYIFHTYKIFTSGLEQRERDKEASNSCIAPVWTCKPSGFSKIVGSDLPSESLKMVGRSRITYPSMNPRMYMMTIVVARTFQT